MAQIAAHLNAEIIVVVTVAKLAHSPLLPPGISVPRLYDVSGTRRQIRVIASSLSIPTSWDFRMALLDNITPPPPLLPPGISVSARSVIS